MLSSFISSPNSSFSSQFVRNVVKVHFYGKGADVVVEAKKGDNIQKLAARHKLPLPFNCEGNGGCATCHCYIHKGDKLLTEASEYEYDVMDYAPAVMDDSRLACRCFITSDDGEIEVEIPKVSRNIAM